MNDQELYNLILDIIELARERNASLRADREATCLVGKRFRRGLATIESEIDLRLRLARYEWLRADGPEQTGRSWTGEMSMPASAPSAAETPRPIVIRREYRIIPWPQRRGCQEFEYALVDPLGQVVQLSWSAGAALEKTRELCQKAFDLGCELTLEGLTSQTPHHSPLTTHQP